MSDVILAADEVAALLHCSTEQAENLMRAGALPATKIGRGWITTNATVLEYVRTRINEARPRKISAVRPALPPV